MKIIILIFFTIIILTSCDTDNNRCLKSNGEITTVESPLNYFSKININSDFEVYIENSSEASITITAGKNLIPYIDYTVLNKTLTIEDNNGWDFIRKDIKPIIIIKTPVLEEITINQTCDIKTNDSLFFDKLRILNQAEIFSCDLELYGDSLFFNSNSSTGDYKFKGTCDYIYFYNQGQGHIRASHLISDYVRISHLSTGKSHINSSQQIIIEDIQYGSITAYSDDCPEIIIEDSEWTGTFENIGCPD